MDEPKSFGRRHWKRDEAFDALAQTLVRATPDLSCEQLAELGDLLHDIRRARRDDACSELQRPNGSLEQPCTGMGATLW